MSRPNPYINVFYLAVHLALNALVVVLVFNLIGSFAPVKHFFAAHHLNLFTSYHFNLRDIYSRPDTRRNIAAAIAIVVAGWYYQKRKAKTGGHTEKMMNGDHQNPLYTFYKHLFK